MSATRFLIVDDLEGNRKLMSRLIGLHFPGSIVELASGGEEGIRLLQETSFDIVILDAVMPQPNGMEVCRRIRADPRTRSAMVLMVSAQLTDMESRISGLDSGADGYLCKPFENPELIAQIRALMRIHESERELRNQQAHLEQELALRLETEQKLLEANRAAEDAVRAKSEFLAHMSHEIRTPMNAVIGLTEILLSTGLNNDQQDYVQTIHTAGDTLLSVINDILDFSKIEVGKLTLEQRLFSPADLLSEAVRMVRAPAESKKLKLEIVVAKGMPLEVVGDKIRLRQILLNLLSNAVKFTEQGGITVEANACRLDGHWCDIHIAVRDTGIGIPPDKADRLFQSFSQVDDSTTRRYGGTGLGLAISLRLAKLMDGTIWVDSRPGEGSVFHVRICLPLPAYEPAISEESGPTGSDLIPLQGRPVLIVDDNETNRRILSLQAQSWGMIPSEANDAESALLAMQTSQPADVILVEMEMPGMDGISFARQIRSIQSRSQTPMVLVSSIDPDLVSRILDSTGPADSESLFVGRLSKPVRSSTLFNTLISIFQEPVEHQPRNPVSDPGRALRVLVAEDNPVNRKVAALMLRRLGFAASFVEDGNEAVKAATAESFDVVFMDIQMPKLDGVEAMKRIRELLPAERCPVMVAITAHAMQGDRDKYLDLGMDYYLSKPIREADLANLLRQIVRMKQESA